MHIAGNAAKNSGENRGLKRRGDEAGLLDREGAENEIAAPVGIFGSTQPQRRGRSNPISGNMENQEKDKEKEVTNPFGSLGS